MSDATLVTGSQVSKTVSLSVGLLWAIANSPSSILLVMPNTDLARNYSETRLRPIIEATPELAKLVPLGNDRHAYKTLAMTMGGSTLAIIGSNSPSNLASRPVKILLCDETDKFKGSTATEADALSLATQRTKSFANPQRWFASTPSVEDGPIWQKFLEGDQRRFEIPCVHCGKFLFLAWSRLFTIFGQTGREAWVEWDKEAKRPNGDWDMDRVVRSARAVCPHCGGHLRDGDKTKAVRQGRWVATIPGVPSCRSWHLPSLYASTPETTFGRLSMKFLLAKHSLVGLQSFINGELAEPFCGQDTRSERVEVILRGEDAEKPVGEDAVPILTADFQMLSPHVWFVIRSWAKGGDSRLVLAGHCENFDELRQIQLDHKVADNCTFIDSAYDTATIYASCRRHAKLRSMPNGIPMLVGWIPSRGRDRTAGWMEPKTKLPRLWVLTSAPMERSGPRLPLLEFNTEYLRDVLARLRRGEGKAKWELTTAADETYFKHLDAFVRKPVMIAGRVEVRWAQRTQRWPDHLLDCELIQLAASMFHRRLTWTFAPPQKTSEEISLG